MIGDVLTGIKTLWGTASAGLCSSLVAVILVPTLTPALTAESLDSDPSLVSGAGDSTGHAAGIDFAVENPKRARLNWLLNCQGCHGTGAEGSDGGAPAMPDVLGKLLGVEGGRAYLVQVPGVATAPLSDADLADLMNWMLETFDKPNIPKDFVPYEPAEVAALRKTVLFTKAQSVRESLLAGVDLEE